MGFCATALLLWRLFGSESIERYLISKSYTILLMSSPVFGPICRVEHRRCGVLASSLCPLDTQISTTYDLGLVAPRGRIDFWSVAREAIYSICAESESLELPNYCRASWICYFTSGPIARQHHNVSGKQTINQIGEIIFFSACQFETIRPGNCLQSSRASSDTTMGWQLLSASKRDIVAFLCPFSFLLWGISRY
jgi:hypothetical protein